MRRAKHWLKLGAVRSAVLYRRAGFPHLRRRSGPLLPVGGRLWRSGRTRPRIGTDALSDSPDRAGRHALLFRGASGWVRLFVAIWLPGLGEGGGYYQLES